MVTLPGLFFQGGFSPPNPKASQSLNPQPGYPGPVEGPPNLPSLFRHPPVRMVEQFLQIRPHHLSQGEEEGDEAVPNLLNSQLQGQDEDAAPVPGTEKDGKIGAPLGGDLHAGLDMCRGLLEPALAPVPQGQDPVGLRH